MALTATERKRLQVERDRSRAKSQLDFIYDLPRQDFGSWLEENGSEGNLQHLAICYDGMNRLPPNFTDDNDPVSATGSFMFPTTDDGRLSYLGALGRAELEVDLLIEAAKTLASVVNAYKRSVITERIQQIEANELDDPTRRPERLRELVNLSKALERLQKSVRAELPQWQLRG